MANTGTFPIDPATPEGLFRFEVGDVVGAPNVPDNGEATFEFMSDDMILALLTEYPDRTIAKSRALTSMATQLITSAQDIQVDDIRIKTVERANLMLQLATTLGANAILAEASTAFQIVPTTMKTAQRGWYAEGTPRAFGETGF